MSIRNYWLQLIWIFGMGGLLVLVVPKRKELVLGKAEVRWNPFAAIILASFYVLQAAFRGNGFGDTAAYTRSFAAMPVVFSGIAEFMDTVTKDRGFALFSCLIKIIFGYRTVIYYFIIAVIQMTCLIHVYRKYSSDYWLSMFIFIASTEYLSWFHNGIRQFLAVALIFGATDLLVKKKYIPMILVILLASTFHMSALLMLPVIFIVQGKAWNKKTILCILGCIVILFFVDQFTDILDSVLAGTQYSSMVTDWTEWQDDGTNPLRVLVYSVPMLLSIPGYRYIREEDSPIINIVTNMSVLTSGIALVSMVTSGIFMGRLIIYCSVYSSGILLPWEIRKLFNKNSSRIVAAVTVICYLIFYYYQMHYTWNVL